MNLGNTSCDPLLSACELSVSYFSHGGPTIHALDRVSLEIQAGERVGILGESGSGKSTLAAALLGTLPSHAQQTAACVKLGGENLLGLPEDDWQRLRGAHISLIPQDPALALNPVISVGAQIGEVLRAHLPMPAAQRRSRVAELLSEVGFDQPSEIYPAYPHQLSGGQRQRIVIAQATACRPALVIADEPTSKLDASLQMEILALLKSLSQRHGTAFIMISHDPTVLAGFVDRIVVMYAGRIVEEASTNDIFRRPSHPYTVALVGLCARHLLASTRRTHFPVISGETPTLSQEIVGCRFALRCPERMEVCGQRDPELDSVYPASRVSCFKYEN